MACKQANHSSMKPKAKSHSDKRFDWACFFFQAKVGRDKEFKLALQTLRGKDADVSYEVEEIQVKKMTLTRFC